MALTHRKKNKSAEEGDAEKEHQQHEEEEKKRGSSFYAPSLLPILSESRLRERVSRIRADIRSRLPGRGIRSPTPLCARPSGSAKAQGRSRGRRGRRACSVHKEMVHALEEDQGRLGQQKGQWSAWFRRRHGTLLGCGGGRQLTMYRYCCRSPPSGWRRTSRRVCLPVRSKRGVRPRDTTSSKGQSTHFVACAPCLC